jgi:hypothetical protein
MTGNAIYLPVARFLSTQIQSSASQCSAVALAPTLYSLGLSAPKDWDGNIIALGGVEVIEVWSATGAMGDTAVSEHGDTSRRRSAFDVCVVEALVISLS